MPSDKKKIYLVNIGEPSLEGLIDFFKLDNLPITDSFVWDEDNPDYLFATDNIYYDSSCKKTFEYFIRKKKPKVRIFWANECVAPDLNMFDYAITIEDKLQDRDRVAGIPHMIFYRAYLRPDRRNHLTYEEALRMLKDGGRRFCSFIVSNSFAHPNRDNLFYAVSKYKRVESLGKHLNNVKTLITGDGVEWSELSIQIKSRYKFSIASENAQYGGYTSEKLLSSFQAHTVPIYWGNPYAAELYNPEAFINCNDYDSFDEVVARVKEIDEDDDLWAYMVSRPWQTEEQIQASQERYESYRKFITNIFTQPLERARRRPLGTWADNYEKWFFGHGFLLYNKYMRKLRRVLSKPGDAVSKIKLLMMSKTNIEDFFQGEKI